MKKFVVLILVVLNCACTSRYASNGEQLYLKSRNGPKLVVPAPLTQGNINHFYDLPDLTQQPLVDITPPV